MVLAWKCGAVLFDRSNDLKSFIFRYFKDREPVVLSGRTPTGCQRAAYFLLTFNLSR